MKIATALVLTALVSASVGLSPALAQHCPAGSHPDIDSWGNKICKRFSDGSAVTTEVPRGQACPAGAHPWVDKWGNKICRSAGVGNQPPTDYYDASQACPAGSHPSVDKWGKQVCKRF